MPNHVTNQLFVTGEESQIQALKKIVKSEREDFDINAFFPMPTALRNISHPVKIVSNEEYNEWLGKKAAGDISNFDTIGGQPITQDMSDLLIKAYGVDNWYDWALVNWGTKWGSYDSFYISNGDYFEFLTAWDPPISAIKVLSSQFPTLEIVLKFSDEDLGSYVGEVHFFAGQVTAEVHPQTKLEAYLLAMEINGYEGYYTEDLEQFDEETDSINSELTEACIIMAHKKNSDFTNFPKPILEKLLDLAVKDEMYEKATEIKKIIDKINSNT